jgi:hypothetical protein
MKKVKMVVCQVIDMEKVEGLMKMDLVGQLMGKGIKGKTLKHWLDIGWRRNLGCIPMFHMLVRCWICFEFKC